MRAVFNELNTVFTGGCFGGLVNSIAVWLSGRFAVTQALGVKIAPSLTPGWLYPRLVWGGIWGLLFLLILPRTRPLTKGLLVSLGPSLGMFFWVFPSKAQAGMFGMQLGTLTPVLVLIFNAIWGVAAAYWIKSSLMS